MLSIPHFLHRKTRDVKFYDSSAHRCGKSGGFGLSVASSLRMIEVHIFCYVHIILLCQFYPFTLLSCSINSSKFGEYLRTDDFENVIARSVKLRREGGRDVRVSQICSVSEREGREEGRGKCG